MNQTFRARYFRIAVILILLLTLIVPQWPAAAAKPGWQGDDANEMDCTKFIHYPQSTKKRLDALYHEIYMDYVNLIETYAWSGGLTRDQRALRIKMLKNYITTFKKRNYQWCSEHEPDEWEEEWYNRD